MTRLIVTNTTATRKNMDIFESVLGQISDGIWENSRGMDGYWMNTEITTYEGYIAIRVSKLKYFHMHVGFNKWRTVANRYCDKTSVQIVEFFKTKIKQIADEEIKNNRVYHMNHELAQNATFRTAGNAITRYLNSGAGVTFADAYETYRHLTARGTVDEYMREEVI